MRLGERWALCLLMAFLPSFAEDAKPQTADSLKVVTDWRSIPVAIIAWPFENILQPTFNAILYPAQAPLKYGIQNHLLERGINLITLGSHQQVMLYPTFNLKPGTNSSLGATYRHRGLFDEQGRDYFVNIYSRYINGDWDFRTKYSFNKIFSTLGTYTSFSYKQDRDAMFSVEPFGNKFYQYADTSWSWKTGLNNPLAGNWSWEYYFGVDRKRFDEPAVNVDLLPETPDSIGLFDRYSRGFYQHFWQFPLGVQLLYNTRDNSAAPTSGQFLRMDWNYVPVSKYTTPNALSFTNNSLDHNYSVFSLVYQTYLLIGKKQYKLTRKESNQNQKYLQNMSLEKTMQMLSPEQLKETFFERKVIAVQFRMRQMFESEEGGAPFSGYSDINPNTPLRGYERSYSDFNTYALSCEYRWPIVDMVDGVVFNEYALFGKSWTTPEWGNLRNSWGFGIRVRKPNLFLTRMQIGFHGTEGLVLLLTINPEFQ